MKKIKWIFALAMLSVLLTACGEKKKSNDIIAPRIVEAAPKGPIQMQDYTDERGIDWIGKKYHVSIHRQPSKTLPMVKDENGQEYVDNIFTVVVSRQDGSIFFNHDFTKSSMANHIDENYRKNGILEGVVFDRAEGDWLIFAGSVGLPQTDDEYIPLIIRLSRTGELVIKRDSQMDTTSPTLQTDSESEEI